MIRMIRDEDIFACWWWYNWYITHSNATFETEPLQMKDFFARVQHVRKRYPWIVLQPDEDIVGYAYLDAFNSRSAYDWTCDLAVYLAPDKIGNGYGSILMKEIIDLAKKDGYKKMMALVSRGNTPSEKLHEKFGFTCKAVFENIGNKNGQWLSVSFYEKELAPIDSAEALVKPQNLNPYDDHSDRAGKQ